MAFATPPSVLTGDAWSASQQNTYLRDNMTALWPYTTQGDMVYAASASALTRLAKGAANTALISNGTVPGWARDVSTMIGALNGIAVVESTTEFTTTSTTGVDITGMTVNIVTTKQCDLVLIAHGSIATTGAGSEAVLIPSIGGTNHAVDASCPRTYSAQYAPVAVAWARAGVASGTKTFKLRLKATGGDTAYFIGGIIVALAFVSA